jgi:hypothetical protein
MRTHVWMAGLLCLSVAACGSTGDDRRPGVADIEDDDDASQDPDADSDDPDGDDGVAGQRYSEAEVRAYLRRISPLIVGRSLRLDENDLIAERGEDAIEEIVSGWLYEPGFVESIRFMVESYVRTSGQREGVDFDLPGNLAALIASQDLPWSTLLTADFCVDAQGEAMDCDTGAPYEAGVLATRAFLISNSGRFNLGRAKRLLETFACRVYPMEPQIQPPLEKEVLIPMFRAENAEEQTEEEATGGFGNGLGCYLCHAQFGAHAQLFVRFDDTGVWREDATGLQDPYGELGRSFDGLYTSHMDDPAEAAAETTQVFGETVANMREAADVITQSPLFTECSVKNVIAHTMGLHSGAAPDVNNALVSALAQQITADDSDPSIAAYIQTIFTDERVIDAFIASLEVEQ